MLTEKDFEERFSKYSVAELFEIYSNIEDYSPEAKAAFNKVAVDRGGLEKLLNDISIANSIKNESSRIETEVIQFVKDGADLDFIKKFTTSNILDEMQLDEVIEKAHDKAVAQKKDTEINNRTIAGSLFGGLLASIIGGVLFGIQLIFSARIFYLFIIGLGLLCFFIIKASTKQSQKNSVVFVATIISTILAFVIGFVLYELIGYLGV